MQDIYFLDTSRKQLQKSTFQLSVSDKFTGGAMTQYVLNRLENKIFFASENFIHEVEYASKTGESKF